MARKQEKPESSVEPKDPASTTETSGSQPEDGALTLLPGDAASPNPGESGAPVTDPGPGGSVEQTSRGAPAGLDPASDIAADGLHTGAEAAAAASEAGASEGAGQNGPEVTGSADDADPSTGEDQVAANANPATLQIYPMRSYMDEGELRRRGGPAYEVPRRHAEELVQRKLASFEPLEE